jgi:hypothetical protein
MITDTDIQRMRIAAANDRFVFSVLEDLANGVDYGPHNTCQCGWERMVKNRKPQWSGTWCVHCISVELANITDDTEEL